LGDSLEFSEEDEGLAGIVQTAGDTAIAVYRHSITETEWPDVRFYIVLLVERYAEIYYDSHFEMPSRSLFIGAINEYIDSNFYSNQEPISKIIRGLMRLSILHPLESYRERRYIPESRD